MVVQTARNEVWREHCRKEQCQTVTPSKFRITNPERSRFACFDSRSFAHFERPTPARPLFIQLSATVRLTSCVAVLLLPEKPNRTVPKFARPDSGDSRTADALLQSLSKTKHHHQAISLTYTLLLCCFCRHCLRSAWHLLHYAAARRHQLIDLHTLCMQIDSAGASCCPV